MMFGAVPTADAAPLICTYCTDASWDGLLWLRNLPGVFLGSSMTLVAYLLRRRGEDKALARNLAVSVQTEIARILELLDDTTRTAIMVRPFAAVDRIPTDIYDGQLSSAAVSNFDADLQNRLYNFYKLFKGKHVNEMTISENDLRERAVRISDALDKYIRRKKPTLKFF